MRHTKNKSSTMKVTNLILVAAIVVYQLMGSFQLVSSQAGNGTIGSLSPSIISDVLSILINGTVHLVGNCTNDLNATQVQYWMYNRQNPNGYLMCNFSDIDNSKWMHMLLHGWRGQRDVDYIKVIRDAYLQRFDSNVITVDYGCYVAGDYVSSYCNLPAVSNNLANFVCRLNQYFNISNLHVVGYSLGSHVAGMAGSRVRDQCKRNIRRITGLDPAGPLFQGISTRDRLDATDADFVDIIHTNQGQYGYTGDQGNIDFYPNCGTYQPGCWTVVKNVTLANITDIPLSFVRCNHQRSCSLFAESILSNSFLAHPMLSPIVCTQLTDDPTDRIYMGEYCHSEPGSTSYYMVTNAQSPYGIGPNGPLN